MSKIAIIAAMEREIAPLVRGWQRGTAFFRRKKVHCL